MVEKCLNIHFVENWWHYHFTNFQEKFQKQWWGPKLLWRLKEDVFVNSTILLRPGNSNPSSTHNFRTCGTKHITKKLKALEEELWVSEIKIFTFMILVPKSWEKALKISQRHTSNFSILFASTGISHNRLYDFKILQ